MRRLPLSVLLAVALAAPRLAPAADPPCPPRVTFEWVGPSTVRMWTDAEFATPSTPVTPDPASNILVASWKPSGPGDDPTNPRQYPIIVKVGGLAQPVPRAANHVYVSKDSAAGSTFLVDLQGQRLVANGGRAEVILRDVVCPAGQVKTYHVSDAVVMEQHRLAIDVGYAFSLDGAGRLPGSPEYSLNSYSRWSGPLSGIVDVRMTTFEKVAKEGVPDPSGVASVSFLGKGGNTLDASGRVLYNVDPERWWGEPAPEWTQPWLALVAGAGVRSLPGLSTVDARFRYFGGVRVQVLGYNSDQPASGFRGARSHIEAGYARDWFWRDTIEHRVYATAQLEIPKIGSRYLRFAVRATVDRPTHFGDTSGSEVRLSVLSSINPEIFGSLLGFSPRSEAP